VEQSTDQAALSAGTRELLAEIVSALDMPCSDERITAHAATVAGALRPVLGIGEYATGEDCRIIAGLIRDSVAVTR
jgi:hypothetical protein